MKKILFYLIIIVLVSSCVNKAKEYSIFTNQLCGDLCWGNIVVGETTIEEFLEIASTQPDIIPNTIKSTVYPEGGLFDGQLRYQFLRISGDEDTVVTVGAKTSNGKVVFLIFLGDLGLDFQEVEETFGEPNYVISHWTFDGGINVHFLYPLKGVEITNYYKSYKSEVTPDDAVNYLVFFDPEYYQEFLEADLFSPDYEGLTMYKWEGCGKISEHYWPPE